MNRGIIAAIKWFEEVRREQAQRQSDRDPFLPPSPFKDRSVAPLQRRLNTTVEGEEGGSSPNLCSCQAVCPSCIDYQMTLNQAH